MNNKRLEEIEKRIKELDEKFSMEDLGNPSESIDYRGVGRNQKQEREYKQGLEGELLQAYDETKDISRRQEIFNEIKEIREQEKQEEIARLESIKEYAVKQDDLEQQINNKQQEYDKLKQAILKREEETNKLNEQKVKLESMIKEFENNNQTNSRGYLGTKADLKELENTIKRNENLCVYDNEKLSNVKTEIDKLEEQFLSLEEKLMEYDIVNEDIENNKEKTEVQSNLVETLRKIEEKKKSEEENNKTNPEPEEPKNVSSQVITTTQPIEIKQPKMPVATAVPENQKTKIEIKEVTKIGLKFNDNGIPYYYAEVVDKEGKIRTFPSEEFIMEDSEGNTNILKPYEGFDKIIPMTKEEEEKIKCENIQLASKYYDIGMAKFLKYVDEICGTSSFKDYKDIMKNKLLIKKNQYEKPIKDIEYDFSNLYKMSFSSEDKEKMSYIKKLAKNNDKLGIATYEKEPNILKKLWHSITNKKPRLTDGKHAKVNNEQEHNIQQQPEQNNNENTMAQKRKNLLNNLKVVPENIKQGGIKAIRSIKTKATTLGNNKVFKSVGTSVKNLTSKISRKSKQEQVNEDEITL